MDDPSACLVSTREGEKGVRPPRSVHRLCLSRSHHFSHIPGNSHSFLALYSLATLRQSTSIPLATRRNNVTSTPFSYPAPRKYKPDNPGIFTLPTSSHYRHPLDIIDNHTLFDSQHSTRFDPAWPSVRFINIASFINLFSIIDHTSAHSVG